MPPIEPAEGAESPFLLEVIELHCPLSAQPSLWTRLAPLATALSPAARRILEQALIQDAIDRGYRDAHKLASSVVALRRAAYPAGQAWSTRVEAEEIASVESRLVRPFIARSHPGMGQSISGSPQRLSAS